MAFDTFDEGIDLGGIRSKNEIKTLICYIYYSVKENIGKDVLIQAILKQGLANYFETSCAFDDLVKNGNLVQTSDNQAYSLTENGRIIAESLDDIIPYTAKEKACSCAIRLLAERKNETENKVEISKCENGFRVKCSVSGGDMNLMSVELYAPDMNQAQIIKKNFLKSPMSLYRVTLAFLTEDKESVGEALEDVYGILGQEI